MKEQQGGSQEGYAEHEGDPRPAEGVTQHSASCDSDRTSAPACHISIAHVRETAELAAAAQPPPLRGRVELGAAFGR
jgi:hypothetical protein